MPQQTHAHTRLGTEGRPRDHARLKNAEQGSSGLTPSCPGPTSSDLLKSLSPAFVDRRRSSETQLRHLLGGPEGSSNPQRRGNLSVCLIVFPSPLSITPQSPLLASAPAARPAIVDLVRLARIDNLHICSLGAADPQGISPSNRRPLGLSTTIYDCDGQASPRPGTFYPPPFPVCARAGPADALRSSSP